MGRIVFVSTKPIEISVASALDHTVARAPAALREVFQQREHRVALCVAQEQQQVTRARPLEGPAHAVELAYSDPPPIPPPGGPFCGGTGCEIGGVWSSYWYNNFIYETNITEGLNIFRYSGNETAGAIRLDHLNPQTQMFTID